MHDQSKYDCGGMSGCNQQRSLMIGLSGHASTISACNFCLDSWRFWICLFSPFISLRMRCRAEEKRAMCRDRQLNQYFNPIISWCKKRINSWVTWAKKLQFPVWFHSRERIWSVAVELWESRNLLALPFERFVVLSDANIIFSCFGAPLKLDLGIDCIEWENEALGTRH